MLLEIIRIIIDFCALGGLVALVTIRATRRKADAEASAADANAFSGAREAYQATIEDLNGYLVKIRQERDEIFKDREEIRRENEDLRKRQNDVDERVRGLEAKVARNGRIVASMRPYLCYLIGCKKRILNPVEQSEDGNNA